MLRLYQKEKQVKFRLITGDPGRNWGGRALFLPFVIFSVLLLIRCSGEERLIEEADHWREAGQYDLALNRLQIAYKIDRENPKTRAALGRILSTRNASVFSGLSLMAGALKDLHEPALREELLLLYLDLGRYQVAREMLAPDRIPLEEFFSPRMVILRSGVHCISRPDPRNIQTLNGLGASELRDYFLGRCYLEARERKDQIQEAKNVLLSMGDTAMGCKLAVLFPSVVTTQDSTLQEKIQKCRRTFPGDIDIARERPIGKADSAGNQRLMFSDEFFIPPYPPMDYRSWSEGSELDGQSEEQIDTQTGTQAEQTTTPAEIPDL